MKRICLTTILAGLTVAALAQESTKDSFWDDPAGHPLLPVYAIILLVFITAMLTAVVGIYLIKILNLLATQAEQENARRVGKVYVPKITWWSNMVQKLNAAVPVAEEKNIELDHNYDGIKELDNHLPPWWKWLFWGTIGWSAVYLFVFHLSKSLPLSEEEYHNEIVLAEEQARKLKASQPVTAVDEAALEFTNDVKLIEKGKLVFMNNNCGSCHRNDGGGNTIGPNLTDDYWLHGGDVKNIFAIIKNGAIEKGMPAWERAMKPEDLRDVTFFVMSLRGTNPENAKAPQGELFEMIPEKSDTTDVQASL